MKRRQKTHGFTLIELMIVVGIVGILAAIAIPNYLRNVLRSKQAESATIMNVIKNQQYAFIATHDCFASTQPNPPLGSGPVGPAKITWDPTSSGAVGDLCGQVISMIELGVMPHTRDVYFRYQCDASATGDEFSCNALGDLDGNGAIYEMAFCTDNNADGLGIPTPAGTVCAFFFDPVRVSPAIF